MDKILPSQVTTPSCNSRIMAYPEGQNGSSIMQFYWLFSVIERAKSTDPEKIIKIRENDSFQTINGKILAMRSCDHKVIQDLVVTEFVPPKQQKVSYNISPYYWHTDCFFTGSPTVIPAAKILSAMDQGKDGWGK